MTDADDMQTSPLSWPGERHEAPFSRLKTRPSTSCLLSSH